MLKRISKYIGFLLLFYTILCLATPFNTALRNRSIKNQINYLSGILDKGYDDSIQNRYPEGKLFSNALLALSTIEFCGNNGIVENKYVEIIDNCIKRIQSKKTLETFNPNIQPQYGIFYNGWSNFVYSTYQKSPLFEQSAIQEEVRKESIAITERITQTLKDSIRILDSYIAAQWPADNLIAMISFSNDSLRQNWLDGLVDASEHPDRMIFHSTSDKSEVRGSSSALITYSLQEIGYKNIDAYNEILRDNFVDEFLGVELVKENQNGSNESDYDSGPVVFGYGASATIMNIKTQASLHSSKAKFTYAAMNFISAPIHCFETKYYLFKQEPMFDLFMLWSSVEL